MIFFTSTTIKKKLKKKIKAIKESIKILKKSYEIMIHEIRIKIVNTEK